MFRMTNPVRDYAWGSTSAFSTHFGWAPSTAPQAEIWMGAHPAAPSSVTADDGAQTSLLEHFPGKTAPSFPYLLKVLAAERPLSIQTHPAKEQAEAGFSAEEAAGIPADSPQRNYVDPNHKPELIVALGSFSALCGFRPQAEAKSELCMLRDVLEHFPPPPASQEEGASQEESASHQEQGAEQTASEHPPLAPLFVFDRLVTFLDHQDYAGALDYILRSGREDSIQASRAVNALFSRRAGRAPRPRTGLPSKTIDTLTRVTRSSPGDPSILVTLLMNRVDLSPGEALYLPAGNLHAYLYGLGVEIMANSDNVLRGGLTSKHVDVEELLSVTACEVLPIPHCPAEQAGPGRYSYRPPFEEFQLKRIEFPQAQGPVRIHPTPPAVLLCTAGELEVTDDDGARLRLGAGESALLTAEDAATITAEGRAQAFLALPGRAPGSPLPADPADRS